DRSGYAGLSQLARAYVGGLLAHAPALLAFCAPTTNSYRRLVPGYEAPVNLVYSMRNRSACIRIPMYSDSPKAKRIEFRWPDASANPYLAFAAMLMAGLHGIQKGLDAGEPADWHLFEEDRGVVQVPGSLAEARDALATFQTEVPSWAEWDVAYLPGHRLVADLLGEVVGWAALSPASHRRCYAGVTEDSIYVARGARGLGIKHALLKTLITGANA